MILLLFCWGVAIGAAETTPKSMQQVKELILQKKTSEAITLFKECPQDVFSSPQNQKQMAQWLRIFNFDTTIGLYEKTIEMMASGMESSEIEKNFKIALEKEPFNTPLATADLGYLIGKEKLKIAREKVLALNKELPWMEVYRVFLAWLERKEGTVEKIQLHCESPTLTDEEKDFCELEVLAQKIKDSKGKQLSGELLQLFNRIKLPNKYQLVEAKWHKTEDHQKYLSSCQKMSGKQKKAYLFVPEFCVTEEDHE